MERVNQTLLQENNRLKSQFSSQEQDRNFLIKQLVAVKKDNARLRAEYTAIEAENESFKLKIKDLIEEKAVASPSKNHISSGTALTPNYTHTSLRVLK